MPQPIIEMVGIGPKSADWLRRAGIHNRQDLEALGPVEAYRRVRALGVRPSLNLLWALQGALLNLHWTMVPPQVRDRLKQELAEKDAGR